MPIELIPPALAGVLGLVAAALSTRLPLPESPMRPTWRRWTAMGMASVLLGVWSGLAVGWPLAVVGAPLAVALLLIAVIDAEHFWLPNILTLPLGAAGLAASAFIGPGSFVDHLIGAVLGFAVLAGLAALYKRLRGRDGLGGGDARLLAAIGAWVGWAGLPSVVVWQPTMPATGMMVSQPRASRYSRDPVGITAPPTRPLRASIWMVMVNTIPSPS
jgi:leader peptidase (prepilin peptidase)/N-methyltransferase